MAQKIETIKAMTHLSKAQRHAMIRQLIAAEYAALAAATAALHNDW